jgi:adenylate kinase family enzyme
MFTTTFSIDSKRQKKGGNVFYTPEIAVNADANLQMSKEDMETLSVFQDVINKENTEVVDLYKAAKKGAPIASDAKTEEVVAEVNDPIKTLSA